MAFDSAQPLPGLKFGSVLLLLTDPYGLGVLRILIDAYGSGVLRRVPSL